MLHFIETASVSSVCVCARVCLRSSFCVSAAFDTEELVMESENLADR